MVETTMNYMAPMDERPFYYLYEPPAGVDWRNSRGDRRTVAVHDARELDAAPTLDDRGFMLATHRTSVADLYDDDTIRSAYYPEMEDVVARVTGAARVLAFDHNVRCADLAEKPDNVAQNPVRLVHNDYTAGSGPQRVRDLLPADEAEALVAHRFAVINAWKPIVGPVTVSPLAVCDARSMQPDDFVATDLRYEDRTGEIYSVAFSPGHRWFYYPAMQADELMLLKCFDTDPKRARFTAHTAFDDPGSPADAPARESIEVRTLAFFEPEA